jgi:hypothetical protein
LFPSNLASQVFFVNRRTRAKNSKEKRRLRRLATRERIITSLLCDESGHRARTSLHISQRKRLATHTLWRFSAAGPPNGDKRADERDFADPKRRTAQTDTANAAAVFFLPQTFFHACCSQLNHKVEATWEQ